jgi:hypothetical protein
MINLGDEGITFFSDIDGTPLNVLEWAEKTKIYRQTGENRVRKSFLPGGHALSTVWIGMDDNRFETALFHEGKFVEIVARSMTWDEADKIHLANVVKYNAMFKPKPRKRKGERKNDDGECNKADS